MVQRTLTWFQKFRLFVEPYRTVIANIVVTFIQAAVSTWAATGFATDKIALSGAVGAGLSAAYNLVIKPYLKKNGWMQ